MNRIYTKPMLVLSGCLAAGLSGCSQTLYYGGAVSDGGGATDSDGRPPDTLKRGLCGAAEGQLFGEEHPWNQAVDERPLDDESDAVIAFLDEAGSWPGLFEIAGVDRGAYGLPVLVAGDAPRESFDIREDAFWRPHCDYTGVPLPEGGAVEAEADYECRRGGDCHLVVLDEDACRLYEMYRASRTDDGFLGGCLAVWDLTGAYTPTLRGDGCTSAEAAGLPIAPLTFSADEIAAGEIRHALRFSMPNEHVRASVYVRPATHTSDETSGGPGAPPRGARLRLKATFDDSDLSPEARILTAALKRYGMILTDPGDVTFVAEDDRFTANRWDAVGMDSDALSSLRWSDFEVVEGGERFLFDDGACERTVIEE